MARKHDLELKPDEVGLFVSKHTPTIDKLHKWSELPDCDATPFRSVAEPDTIATLVRLLDRPFDAIPSFQTKALNILNKVAVSPENASILPGLSDVKSKLLSHVICLLSASDSQLRLKSALLLGNILSIGPQNTLRVRALKEPNLFKRLIPLLGQGHEEGTREKVSKNPKLEGQLETRRLACYVFWRLCYGERSDDNWRRLMPLVSTLPKLLEKTNDDECLKHLCSAAEEVSQSEEFGKTVLVDTSAWKRLLELLRPQSSGNDSDHFESGALALKPFHLPALRAVGNLFENANLSLLDMSSNGAYSIIRDLLAAEGSREMLTQTFQLLEWMVDPPRTSGRCGWLDAFAKLVLEGVVTRAIVSIAMDPRLELLVRKHARHIIISILSRCGGEFELHSHTARAIRNPTQVQKQFGARLISDGFLVVMLQYLSSMDDDMYRLREAPGSLASLLDLGVGGPRRSVFEEKPSRDLTGGLNPFAMELETLGGLEVLTTFMDVLGSNAASEATTLIDDHFTEHSDEEEEEEEEESEGCGRCRGCRSHPPYGWNEKPECYGDDDEDEYEVQLEDLELDDDELSFFNSF